MAELLPVRTNPVDKSCGATCKTNPVVRHAKQILWCDMQNKRAGIVSAQTQNYRQRTRTFLSEEQSKRKTNKEDIALGCLVQPTF